MSETKRITQDDKIWAALSYLWIMSVVALALKKNNEYVRFHANQGFFLFLVSLVCFIPILGQLVGLVAMIFAIVGIIKAYKGYKWPLPMLDSVAKEVGEWFVKTIKI